MYQRLDDGRGGGGQPCISPGTQQRLRELPGRRPDRRQGSTSPSPRGDSPGSHSCPWPRRGSRPRRAATGTACWSFRAFWPRTRARPCSGGSCAGSATTCAAGISGATGDRPKPCWTGCRGRWRPSPGAPAARCRWWAGAWAGFSRELARQHPGRVRQVITLGSPFALTDPRQSRADGAYRRRRHLHADGTRVPTREQVARPIGVPSTAVYSRRDGIVSWQTCVEPETAQHENVEVRCAHLGFGTDPATLWLIADRLAAPAGRWRPFRPPPLLRRLYPGR